MKSKVPVIEVSSQYKEPLGRSQPQKVSGAQVSPPPVQVQVSESIIR